MNTVALYIGYTVLVLASIRILIWLPVQTAASVVSAYRKMTSKIEFMSYVAAQEAYWTSTKEAGKTTPPVKASPWPFPEDRTP